MEIRILGSKMRVEIIILCMIIGGIMSCNVFCSCAGGVKEGFQTALALSGAAIDYTTSTQSVDLLSNLETNHVEPSEEGQKFFFAQNEMSPSCCPATYSGSTGCVCATPEQMKFLMERGGNNNAASTCSSV